ncbi:MAG: hypothetical protein ACE5EI_01080 [Thermodesulfobacteriota bacterium]
MREIFRPDGRVFPVAVILAAVALLTGRYLLYGVPHEFITGEYKGTFEGDYDFTLELVRAFRDWRTVPLWSETYSGPVSVFASNFHVFAQALLYPLTGSLSLSIKILQVTQLLVAGLGMYTFSAHLFRDRVAAAFSAVLYMFTPFYIGHLLSYLHYTGVYLGAPLVFYLIMRTVEERSYRMALALSIVTVYSLLSHPQNVFIGGIFYALFFLMVSAHEFIESAREGFARAFLGRIAGISVVITVVVFLLSAFTVLPTIIDNYPYLRTSWVKGAEGLVHVDHGHIESHSQSLLAAVTLQHWPWLQTPLKGGQYPAWSYMAVFLMPFVFTSVSLLIRFNWLVLSLMVLVILSVQTSLGVHGHPDLFTFASRHLPFFGMSRTPYAYTNIAFMVFCLLPSVTFIWLASRLACFSAAPAQAPGTARGAAPSSTVRWLVFAALAVPYLLAARHYGNSYNWTFISAREPKYLSRVWSFMDDNNGGGGRVIETCGIPTAMLLGSKMLPNQVDLLERYHGKDYLGRYLALLGFRYVVTPRMHSQRNKTFDVFGYTPPSVFDRTDGISEYYSALTTEYYYIYDRLSRDPGFALHTAGTRDVALFENRRFFAPYTLYPARPVMVLGGTESYDLLNMARFFPAGGPAPAPVFIAQSENAARLDELRRVSTDLVLHNTDSLDLYMYLARARLGISRPEAVDPADWSLAIRSFGIQQPFPQQDHSIGNSLHGELTFADYAITARRAGSSVRRRFDVPSPGRYAVMFRSYGGPGYSDISVSIDGEPVGTVGQKRRSGYRWLTLWSGALDRGAHTVEAALAEDLPVFFDSIAIVPLARAEGAGLSVRGVLGDPVVTYIVNFRKFTLSPKGADGTQSLETTLTTAPSGVFRPSLRLARFKDLPSGRSAGDIDLLIDERPVGRVPLSALSTGPAEFTLPEVRLAAGVHEVKVAGLADGVYFDFLALSDARRPQEGAPGEGGFTQTKTGPSEYRFSFNAPDVSRPLFLVFNETNYPGWKLVSRGRKTTPVVTNMFMSGFILKPDPEGGDGGAEGVIYYSNTAQRTGVWLSVVTFLSVLLLMIAGPYMRRG